MTTSTSAQPVTTPGAIPVATEPMFAGHDLSDISGPNGISSIDAHDLGFITGGITAAAYLGSKPTSKGGTGWRAEKRETLTQKADAWRDKAIHEHDEAKTWREAKKDGSFNKLVKDRVHEQAKNKIEEAERNAVGKELEPFRTSGTIPSDSEAARIDAIGKAAAKKAAKGAEKQVAKEGARLAAKKAAMMGAKRLGARAAAMAAGAAIPGPGWLVSATILIATFVLDKDLRNMVTGWMSHGMDANQPPQPPKTSWLPATDDNRQHDIAPVDAKLASFNRAVTGIDPGTYRLWHLQQSQVPGLSNLSPAVAKLRSAVAKAADVSGRYVGLLNDAPDHWGQQTRSARTAAAHMIADFGPKAAIPLATELSSAASAANDAYQQVREGNANARQKLANSHGRFLGFIGGGSGADHLMDTINVDAIQRAVNAVSAAEKRISDSVGDWNTAALRATNTLAATANHDPHPLPEPPKPTPTPTPAQPQQPPAVAPVTKPSDDTHPKTPEPSLRGLVPPQLGNPLGGGPGLGSPLRGLPAPASLQPRPQPHRNNPEEPKKPHTDDNSKHKESGSKKPGKTDTKTGKPGLGTTPAGLTGVKKQPPATKKRKPSAVVNIPNVGPVDFKDPKIAQLVQRIENAEDTAPANIRSLAKELGMHVGGPDQPLGPRVSDTKLTPGNVIASSDGKDYIYVGQDQVLGEDKKIYPLSKVHHFSKLSEGMFSLDTGSPEPNTSTPVGQHSAHTDNVPSTPAKTSPGTPPADPPPPGSLPTTTPIDPTTILPS